MMILESISNYSKFISLIAFSLFIQGQLMSQEIEKNKASIFIQGGYFNAKTRPSISGIQTFNIGFIKDANKRRSWGVELLLNKGSNNDIAERTNYGLDSITMDVVPIITLIGGDQSYFEIESNFFIFHNIISKNKFSAGLMYLLGANWENIDTNPDPNGDIRNDSLVSFRTGANAFLNFKLSESISLFTDVSMLQLISGIDEFEIMRASGENSTAKVILTDVNLFNHFHVGLVFNL